MEGKRNKINTLILTMGLSAFILFMMALTPNEVWKAPASAKNIQNPLKGNIQATNAGEKLFANMCSICHGNKGKGDGVAGMALKPRPSNLTLPIVQTQTDGEIYWKMNEGRAPMASYKEILTEEQLWQLINYLRELKK